MKDDALYNLEYFTSCPLCQKDTEEADIILLDEADARTTFHVTCAHCNATLFLFVSAHHLGLMSVGLVVDLTGKEAEELFHSDAVSDDHVLDVHETLKKYDGSMKELVSF